jgi:hypothetical protein
MREYMEERRNKSLHLDIYIPLPPAVVSRVATRGGGSDLAVGVRFPGNGAVVLPDVFVLDRSARREVNGDCYGHRQRPDLCRAGGC